MRKNTPPDFTPPYEAFEAKYAAQQEPLACCFIGVQDRGGDAAAARASLRKLLASEHGPSVTEQGWHDDTAGARTYVVMAYWRDLPRYLRWLAAPPLSAWLEAATRSLLVGHFIESAVVPPRGLDTLIADPKVSWGLSKLANEIVVTPYHAYWGGTRDRILQSAEEPLLNPEGEALPEADRGLDGIGQIIDVMMPKNAVVARGGPDWEKSVSDELAEFRSSVYPAYVRGGRYLASHPAEAGCYAAYLLQETDAEGRDVKRNHLIAYFTELSHLERWTRSHPTHLDIFGRYLAMIKNLDGRLPAINLYHEISVMPEGGLTATYSNCLPETGMLRFGTPRRPS
jgi:phenylacetaldoxime dehydratase/aldoxime dehydratase